MSEGGSAVSRPAPVGAAVKRIGKPADFEFAFVVLVEIGAGDKYSGKQYGRIDG